MVGAICLATLVGGAAVVAVAALLLLPAVLLSRFLQGIQTPSVVVAREPTREASQGSRLVTRSSL